jgi:N-terminal acetyltransferase B complex catalytic subunit
MTLPMSWRFREPYCITISSVVGLDFRPRAENPLHNTVAAQARHRGGVGWPLAPCARATAMTTLRPFTCDDLFTYNDVNTDVLTETFHLNFYLGYLATWPEYFTTASSPGGTTMGYVMGKVEGRGTNWHGHVTAVTVAPSYRRMGLAKLLMRELESISQEMHDGYFVDLFVRKSNVNAIAMYEGLGYATYRTVLDYYSGEEDALDMRKALRRDPEKKSMVPLPKPVRPWELGDDFS